MKKIAFLLLSAFLLVHPPGCYMAMASTSIQPPKACEWTPKRLKTELGAEFKDTIPANVMDDLRAKYMARNGVDPFDGVGSMPGAMVEINGRIYLGLYLNSEKTCLHRKSFILK